MEPQDPQTPQKSPRSYGKRSIWRWVVIYIVAAIIIYALVYLLFMRGGSGSGGY